MVIHNEELDEELMAHQRELEEQQQLARRQQEEAERAERARQRRAELLKKAAKPIKKAIKKRVGALAARAAVAAAPYVLPVLAVGIGILLIIFVVLVSITALCNAEGYTGLLANVGSASLGLVGAPDYCEQLAGLQGAVSGIDQAEGAFCSTPQFLAQQNNVPYPAQNDPDLDALITCISGQVANPGSVFTFDNSADICNYTRGIESCAQCSHSQNSCHYGGGGGVTGSLAVDFGGTPGAGQEGVIGPQILQAAAACSAQLNIPMKRATCENEVGSAVACVNPGANHVHISLAKCDRDNGPINLQ